MRRLSTLVTPFLVVGAFVLHRGDFISGRQALAATVAVELLLFSRMFWRIGSITRVYRQGRKSGDGAGIAFRDAIVRSGGGPFAPIFLGEALVWLSLWRFARGGWRRRDGDFSYHRRSPLVGLVFVTVITAPAELLIIELIVPWRPVKLILLLIALYSLLWILGYAASQIGSPHQVTAGELLVRKGFLASARVPLDAIERIEVTRDPLPPAAERWGAAMLDGVGYFSIAGKAEIRIRSRGSVVVRHLVEDSAPVNILRIAVDEPERFVRAVESRLESVAPAIDDRSDPAIAS